MFGHILKIILPYIITFMLSYLLTCLGFVLKLKGHIHIPLKPKARKKAPMGVMDKILVIELVAIILYIIVDFIVFWHVGAEPSTLTMSFFAVCGGENGFMAWIKTRKQEERYREWQKNDEGRAEEYKPDQTL